jgi:hypothetical protein
MPTDPSKLLATTIGVVGEVVVLGMTVKVMDNIVKNTFPAPKPAHHRRKK